jgi:hypothetical protein
MEAMRQSWTDDRLDEFRHRVDERFDRVDRELVELRSEMREQRGEFAALNRTIIQVGGGVIAAMLAIVLTQLS